MAAPSPLDEPENASFAWRRYKRLMRLMVAVTLLVVLVALVGLYLYVGPVSWHFYLATGLGIGFAMLLMSALMGLVFLSSGTGHDASVTDSERDRDRF